MPHYGKVIANPQQLPVVTNATRVINSVVWYDKFVPYLAVQLQKVPGDAISKMDSATACISASSRCFLMYKFGLCSCCRRSNHLHSSNVFLALMYCECHHQLYMEFAEKKDNGQLEMHITCLLEFGHRGLRMAKAKLEMPKTGTCVTTACTCAEGI